MNDGIAITGPGRSGTSIVARVLQVCGLYLGEPESLMPGGVSNPDGYWEHTGIVAINDAILDHFDAGWDLPPVSPSWDDPALSEQRTLALRLLDGLSDNAAWGWKDPRTSFTLPFWQALAPNLRTIICLRHPHEVAASLHRYHFTSMGFGRKWWMDCATSTLVTARDDQLLVVDIDAMRKAPSPQLRRLCNHCRLVPDDETLAHAVALIEPDRHGHYDVSQPLPEAVNALYERLKGMSRYQ